MKKISKNILLTVFALPLIMALPAQAQSYVSSSFLNGYSLTVTNNSTNFYAGTNIYAKGYIITNSTTYPYVSSASPIMMTNTQAFSDVNLWANRDGTTYPSPPAANISVTMHGTSALFTNVALLTFAAIPGEMNSTAYPAGLFGPATQAQNQFSFQVTGNGTNRVSLQTNLPTLFLQGSKGLRLLSVSFTNTGGAYGSLDGVFLDGYKPSQ